MKIFTLIHQLLEWADKVGNIDVYVGDGLEIFISESRKHDCTPKIVYSDTGNLFIGPYKDIKKLGTNIHIRFLDKMSININKTRGYEHSKNTTTKTN